ncbi:ABC transporter permease [Deinococcus detaillensis]|uniref:ABC transporter permease n=1 Tax=Deinococcus detaillensis TaxID=2592048 RepID=A0A553UPB3_9DEIO|nr:ABC transporter permease [Deinococcus detaillensis]TSA82046.1 ABC transporter permease [Deinococcus detaillensis]
MTTTTATPTQTSRRQLWRKVSRNRLTLLGLFIIGVMVLAVVLAPWLAPYDPVQVEVASKLQPPSAQHWMGTDQYGRDVLARIIYGTRYDLLIAVSAVALAAGVGTPLGMIAGYFGGRTEGVIMRCMDLLLVFPDILLAITLAAVLGPSLSNAILAVSIIGIAGYARLAHSSTLTARELMYVEAARAVGMSTPQIIRKAILPNIVSPIMIRATLGMGFAVLLAASLGFIGLGAQPPTPEWGAMINEGRTQIISGAWWTSVFPGLAIVLLVTGFNLLGDGLRDIFDPRAAY